MMTQKRGKPYDLLVLESLKNRMTLEHKYHVRYVNLSKGYGGESCLDDRIDKIKHCIVLKDLSFTIGGVDVQLDTVIITSKGVILCEVKNYEGEFVYREESLYKLDSKIEIYNPLLRLPRSKLLLKQVLKELNYGHMPVEAVLVYVNPNFSLYEAPYFSHLVLPTNINSYFEQVEKNLEPLTHAHTILADKLCSLNQPKKYEDNLPQYKYEMLKKGMICLNCNSFIESLAPRHQSICCEQCGSREKVQEAIERHVKEYQFLFPERKVAVSAIKEWCGGMVPEKRIRQVLKKK